jgi:hypothetical protein
MEIGQEVCPIQRPREDREEWKDAFERFTAEQYEKEGDFGYRKKLIAVQKRELVRENVCWRVQYLAPGMELEFQRAFLARVWRTTRRWIRYCRRENVSIPEELLEARREAMREGVAVRRRWSLSCYY